MLPFYNSSFSKTTLRPSVLIFVQLNLVNNHFLTTFEQLKMTYIKKEQQLFCFNAVVYLITLQSIIFVV